MANALTMDTGEMRELFGDGTQAMRINSYPPCPQPELVWASILILMAVVRPSTSLAWRRIVILNNKIRITILKKILTLNNKVLLYWVV